MALGMLIPLLAAGAGPVGAASMAAAGGGLGAAAAGAGGKGLMGGLQQGMQGLSQASYLANSMGMGGGQEQSAGYLNGGGVGGGGSPGADFARDASMIPIPQGLGALQSFLRGG